jgi:hypothetical protein
MDEIIIFRTKKMTRQIYEDFLDIKGAEGASAEDVTQQLVVSSKEDVPEDLSS